MPRRPTAVPRRARAIQLQPPADNPTPAQEKRELRAVLQASTESLAMELESWLRRGAVQNPLGAVAAFASLAEYCLPRLARTEQVQKPAQLSKEELEELMKAAGLDPEQVWKKLA